MIDIAYSIGKVFPTYTIETKTRNICFMNKEAELMLDLYFRDRIKSTEQIDSITKIIAKRLGNNDVVMFSSEVFIDGTSYFPTFRCQYMSAKRKYIQVIVYSDLNSYVSAVDMSVFAELVPSGLMLIEITEDKKYTTKYINSGLLNILGYTREEWNTCYSQNAIEIIYSEHLEENIRQPYQHLYKTGSLHLNGRLKRKDGGIVVISFIGKLTPAMNGKALIYCAVKDILHQEALPKESFEDKQVYSVLKNVSSHTIFKYEILEQKISFYEFSLKNALDKSFAEYTIEQVLNAQLKYGYDNENMKNLFSNMEQGISSPKTILVYDKGCEKKWLSFKYDFIYDKNGKITSTIGLIENITQQVNAKAYYDKIIALWSIEENCITQAVINLTENTVDGKNFLSPRKNTVALSSEEYFAKVLSTGANVAEREKLKALLDKNFLINSFLKGDLKFQYDLEARIKKEHCWTRITVELLKNPINNCIIALVKWKNINGMVLQNKVNQILLADTYDFTCCIFTKTDSYLMIQNTEKNNLIPNSCTRGYEKFINSIIDRYSDQEDIDYLKFSFSIKNLVSQLKINKSYTFIGHGAYPDGTPSVKFHQFSYLNKTRGIILYSRKDITNQNKRFSFKSDGKILNFDFSKILCIESFGRKAEITTLEGSFIANESISSIQERLSGKIFMRCHRSYIINIARIQKYEKNYVQLTNQKEVPINRKSSAFIKNKLKS